VTANTVKAKTRAIAPGGLFIDPQPMGVTGVTADRRAADAERSRPSDRLALSKPTMGHEFQDGLDLIARRMSVHGTKLPISDVRFHGEYWGQSGLTADAPESALMTPKRHRPN
jgi:hypothetical protein